MLEQQLCAFLQSAGVWRPPVDTERYCASGTKEELELFPLCCSMKSLLLPSIMELLKLKMEVRGHSRRSPHSGLFYPPLTINFTKYLRSIHPSSSSYLRLGQSQQAQQGNPDISLPRDTLQLLLEDPEVFPGQMGCTPSAITL